MQLVKGHAFKQGAASLHEILLRRTKNEIELLRTSVAVAVDFLDVVYGIPECLPGVKDDEVAVGIVAR